MLKFHSNCAQVVEGICSQVYHAKLIDPYMVSWVGSNQSCGGEDVVFFCDKQCGMYEKAETISGVGFTSRYWNHQHWRKCTWKVRIIQESWWSIWEAGKKSLPIWVDTVLAPLVKNKCAQKKNQEKPAHLLLHLWHTGGLGLSSNNSSSRWRKGRQRRKTKDLKRILSLNNHPPLQHTQECFAPLSWVFSCFGSLLLWLQVMSPCCNPPLPYIKQDPRDSHSYYWTQSFATIAL